MQLRLTPFPLPFAGSLRVTQQNKTAAAMAAMLERHPVIEKVHTDSNVPFSRLVPFPFPWHMSLKLRLVILRCRFTTRPLSPTETTPWPTGQARPC